MRSNNDATNQTDICLGCAGTLIRPWVSDRIPVEFITTAIEFFRLMVPAKFYDTAGAVHCSDSPSKKPGSLSKRAMRGRLRGGASGAAKNASGEILYVGEDQISIDADQS